jgi:hypothetical protein
LPGYAPRIGLETQRATQPHRLDQVVVSAGVEAGNALFHVAARGQDQHRHALGASAPVLQPVQPLAQAVAEQPMILDDQDAQGAVSASQRNSS